ALDRPPHPVRVADEEGAIQTQLVGLLGDLLLAGEFAEHVPCDVVQPREDEQLSEERDDDDERESGDRPLEQKGLHSVMRPARTPRSAAARTRGTRSGRCREPSGRTWPDGTAGRTSGGRSGTG